MTTKNEPLLIHFDEANFLTQKERLEAIGVNIQEVVDTFHLLDIGQLASEEIPNLFNNTASLVFDKMTEGKPLLLAGHAVDKVKAIELILKPVGFDNLLLKIKQVAQLLDTNYLFKVAHISATYCLENGVIKISSTKLEQLEKQYKKFATSDVAKNVFDFTQSVISKANELGLMEHAIQNPNGFIGFLNGVFDVPYNKKPPVVSTKAIDHYNNEPNRPFVR